MKVEKRAAPMPDELSPAVMSAIVSGKKIQAVKLLRQETGLGLREAKAIVDALSVEQSVESSTPVPGFREEGGANGLLAIGVAAVFAYVLYRLFVGG